MRYLVETSTPHMWSSGGYSRWFDTLLEAREFAESKSEGKWGQERYRSVKIHHVTETEEIN